MKQPLLSIITVCKDNVQDLHITLGSIVDSLPLEKIEIIVVSGSSDENFDCELQLFPDNFDLSYSLKTLFFNIVID